MPNDATNRFFRGLRALPPIECARGMWARTDLPRIHLYSPLYEPRIELRAGMKWEPVRGWHMLLVAVHPPVPEAPGRSVAWMVEALEQIRELCFRIPPQHLELVGYRSGHRIGTVMLLRIAGRIQFFLDRVDRGGGR